MGSLPQMPTDFVLPWSITPFTGERFNMCQACTFADDVAEDIFHDINDKLNGQIAIEDMVWSTRTIKGWPIQREGEERLVGFQMEHSIIQEYPAINCLIMVSVYSQHIAVVHNRCVYGWMVRVHIAIPRWATGNLMGILENRLSLCFTEYCECNGLPLWHTSQCLTPAFLVWIVIPITECALHFVVSLAKQLPYISYLRLCNKIVIIICDTCIFVHHFSAE